MEAVASRGGAYHAAYTSAEEGVHRIEVIARAGADTVQSRPAFATVGGPTNEYAGVELQAPLLRRIAEETGGQYYTAATASGLITDLVYSEAGRTTSQVLDLWDMPILILGLLALIGGEWMYRRARGLI